MVKKLVSLVDDLKVWVDEISELTEYDRHRAVVIEAAILEAIEVAKSIPSHHVLPREWHTWFPMPHDDQLPWGRDESWVRALSLDDIELQPQKTKIRIKWQSQGPFEYGRLGRRHGRKYPVFISDTSGQKTKIKNIGAGAPYNEVWVIR